MEQSPLTEIISGLDHRLERIEDKLDVHLERVSKLEAQVEWIRGHVTVVLTIAIGIAGFLGTVLWGYLFPHK